MIILDDVKRFRLRMFYGLFAKAEETAQAVKGTFEAWGLNYEARYLPFQEGGLLSLLWTYEGVEREERIRIERRESNLRKGSSVYYFICPYSGYRGRLLFTDLKKVLSRRAFRHYYEAQTLSRRDRLFRDMNAREPYRRNGKEFYRGRPTPYGRRVERYNRKIESTYSGMLGELDRVINH